MAQFNSLGDNRLMKIFTFLLQIVLTICIVYIILTLTLVPTLAFGFFIFYPIWLLVALLYLFLNFNLKKLSNTSRVYWIMSMLSVLFVIAVFVYSLQNQQQLSDQIKNNPDYFKIQLEQQTQNQVQK